MNYRHGSGTHLPSLLAKYEPILNTCPRLPLPFLHKHLLLASTLLTIVKNDYKSR